MQEALSLAQQILNLGQMGVPLISAIVGQAEAAPDEETRRRVLVAALRAAEMAILDASYSRGPDR